MKSPNDLRFLFRPPFPSTSPLFCLCICLLFVHIHAMDARRHVATCGLPFSELTPDAPISNTTDDANVLLFFCMRYALCKIARRGIKRISSDIWVSCTLCMLPVLLLRPGRNVLGLTRFDDGGSLRFFSLAPDFLPVSLLPSHLRSGASVTSTPFFLQSNLSLLCR